VIGMYVAGDSPLHRAPAAAKLLGLIAAGALVVWLRQPWQVGLALVAAVAGYRLAGLGWRVPMRQLRPLWPLLLVTAVLHLVLSDWRRAVAVVGTIVVLVLLAALITLTTRTSELVDAVMAAARPLRRVGVDTERLGLMIALGIRCVPVIVALAVEIRDAQRARGLTASPRAFAVPFVVRALRHADALAEALVARGADD
jgi:biotin transport system permease protein